VVVDDRFNILSWNHQAEDFWGLRADEVKGKPFGNLDIGLPIGDMMGLVRGCLGGDGDQREKVLTALNRRGRHFSCRVQCTPLVDAKAARLGVILMMEDRGADGKG
jgi:two-component system CheB/CheR fusion protein